MLAHEGLQVVALRLGDDAPGAVVQELVHHHPVVAEHRPHQLCAHRRDRADIRFQADPADQSLSQLDRARHRRMVIRHRFELDEHPVGVVMDRDVERVRRAPKPLVEQNARDVRSPALGRLVAQPVRGIRADDVGQRAADRGRVAPEHRDRIGGGMFDDARDAAYQHRAMRLDAAWNMDRLDVTIGEIDRDGNSAMHGGLDPYSSIDAVESSRRIDRSGPPRQFLRSTAPSPMAIDHRPCLSRRVSQIKETSCRWTINCPRWH
jgi:hypothetical protein